jgi:hypothetical protein
MADSSTGAHAKAVGDPVQGHGGYVAQATGDLDLFVVAFASSLQVSNLLDIGLR